MTKYREIIRLASLSLSQMNIALSWIVSIVFRKIKILPFGSR